MKKKTLELRYTGTSTALARSLAACLCIATTILINPAARAAPPALNSNPPNEPAAIISALLARDWRNLKRYSGWTDVEYTPLFESFPAYNVVSIKDANGKPVTQEIPPAFGHCGQTMVIQDIKIKEVLQAPDPTTPVNQPRGLANEVLVVVQAQVLAIYIHKLDVMAPEDRCSWLGLEVRNKKTGKTESFFDNVDDDKALLKMIKSFGKLENNYVVVDPDRRNWTYAIPMVLPRSGKGLKRHFVKREGHNQDFVDATEPRWLIQEPYVPEAVHIDAAIKETIRNQTNSKNAASRSCGFAIAESLGTAFKDVVRELGAPACQASKEVQRYLNNLQRDKDSFQTLQRIKRELKP